MRENSKYYYHEWDEAKEEIVFTNASRLTEVIVSDMFITLEGDETPVAPEQRCQQQLQLTTLEA